MEHPVLTAIGVFQILFSVSELEDINIDENGTAIIMSLQEHRKHKAYMTDEESCMKEANSILVSHGYDEMDEKTYQNKITELISCQCIDVRDGMIKLKEKLLCIIKYTKVMGETGIMKALSCNISLEVLDSTSFDTFFWIILGWTSRTFRKYV